MRKCHSLRGVWTRRRVSVLSGFQVSRNLPLRPGTGKVFNRRLLCIFRGKACPLPCSLPPACPQAHPTAAAVLPVVLPPPPPMTTHVTTAKYYAEKISNNSCHFHRSACLLRRARGHHSSLHPQHHSPPHPPQHHSPHHPPQALSTLLLSRRIAVCLDEFC